MYLFARTRVAATDRIVEATAFAVDIAAKASSLSGIEVSAWQVQYGAPLGTLVWTTTVEHTADMAAAGDKVAADNGYLEAVQAADHLFAGPAEDVIAEIVGTAGDGGHRGEYASSVMAQCNPGHIADAMGFGVEMMELVHQTTGRDGIFTRSLYGPWASVAWFSLADTAAQIDDATAALAANPDYLTKVDASADLFATGSGQGRLSRRIA